MPLNSYSFTKFLFIHWREALLRSKAFTWCLVPVMAFYGASVSGAQSRPVEVSSPDYRITLRFTVQPGKGGEAGQDGQLMYSVKFFDKQVFEDSALRLELANQPPLGAAVRIADSTPGSGTDDYTLLAGKTSAVHDAYNSLIIHAAEGANPGRKFDIEARVYND